jgi:methylenetetrahydrofolate dehydrogenase (NADP+)/methenyltetrahydrofolate cyclohydrolase
MKEALKRETAAMAARGVRPVLGAVFAGDHEASQAYSRSKIRLAAELDVGLDIRYLPGDASELKVASEARDLSRDPAVNGVIVELPLPPHVNLHRVLRELDPSKDVDGAHLLNRGRLLRGDDGDGLFPVTPLACLALLEDAGVSPEGMKVTVVGRGETVGLPLAVLLIKNHATVTVCHSRTADLAEAVAGADIVISAAGKPGLIGPSMLRQGQTVLDAGISVLPDGRIAGDVDPEAASVAARLSPVPGGVGSLTAVLLFRNLLRAVRLQQGRSRAGEPGASAC